MCVCELSVLEWGFAWGLWVLVVKRGQGWGGRGGGSPWKDKMGGDSMVYVLAPPGKFCAPRTERSGKEWGMCVGVQVRSE